MSDVFNREWIQTIVTILCALGVLAGFWLSREQSLWAAGNSLQVMDNRMKAIENDISSVKKDVRDLTRFIVKDKMKEHEKEPNFDPKVE